MKVLKLFVNLATEVQDTFISRNEDKSTRPILNVIRRRRQVGTVNIINIYTDESFYLATDKNN